MSQLEKTSTTPREPWRIAAVGSASFVGLLWVLEIIDSMVGHRLDDGGIEPREVSGLDGILWAPLLHADWEHLIGNTLPALILCFGVMMSGVGTWLRATALIWVIAGVGTWLTGADHSIHVGASSLIFGWVVYLVLRGFFHRNTLHIVVGVVIFLVYGSMLLGVLPGQDGVSWQGHLFGAIGGAVAARFGEGFGGRSAKRPGAVTAAPTPTAAAGPGSKGGSQEPLDIDALLRELGE